MKKWYTLIYIVKKYAGSQSECSDFNHRDFLANTNDEAKFSPSERSIRNIMDFARSYEVLDSDSTGQIELNSN